MSETTLRDTISALVDKSEAGEPLTPPESKINIPAPTVEKSTEAAQVAQVVESEEEKGRTAGRSRDEKGRLLPGKAVEVSTTVTRPARPSSWKKEYWDDWEKLDPRIAEYVNQREGEYAKGVSTYKTEWEQAKPLIDAIAPYVPDLQLAGVSPAHAISRLASTHQSLMQANPQQKLQLFANLARDYQVPLQALYDPAFAQQFAQQQQMQQQQPAIPVETLVEAKMSEYFSKQSVQNFGEAKDDSGNPRYPHFETVRNTMAQLLDAGLANDLDSAYGKSLRMHDDLWKSEQESKVKADEAARQAQQAQAVQTAKRNAISPKSATPATAGAGARKGLREQLSSAFDEVTQGRV